MKLSLAHISDPHFGTSSPQKIAALVKALKALAPDLVLLTGDITQRARRSQFIEARLFCESLAPLDVMAIPGNHDIPLFNIFARLFWPYYGFRRHFQFSLNSRRKKHAVEILALNSTHPWRHVQGELGTKGRRQLQEFAADSQMRIVLAHHPLDCPKPTDTKNILKDAPQALRSLEEAKVDLVLGGHIHDPLARLSETRYPNSSRPMVVVLAGTCLSSRTRANAPNSFNSIEIATAGNDINLQITRFDLSPESEFLPNGRADFYREGRDRWTTLQ